MVVSLTFSAPLPAALTKEQVWNGLLVKAHDGAAFVPMIAETEVINKRANGLTRKVTLKDGRVLHEVVKFSSPSLVRAL
jgi:hypothetical protein